MITGLFTPVRSYSSEPLQIALLLQGIGYFLGHISLIVFCQNRIGSERAGGVESALGHHSLGLHRTDRAVDRDRRPSPHGFIAQCETGGQILAAPEAAFLHQEKRTQK